jgi:DNA-binding CsgD family transcriptional regulator/tetratricopeptide (TPR) repeat protein
LVGRDAALRTLRDRWERACDGHGGAVLVTGEAGVGKSRLVLELMHHASATATTLTGHCVAVGGEPLRHAALVDVVRASGADVGPAATASTGALLELVRTAMDDAPGPLLLVVEDLHWADRATCEVLMVLARSIVDRSVCLLMTSRDDELPRGHSTRLFLAEMVRAQLVTPVGLTRLGPAPVSQLVEGLVGTVDQKTVAAVFRRSGGNPLLVEELCATGFDAHPNDLDPPLLDVLLARADGLSPDALHAAAIIAAAGGSISEDLLAEVLGDEGEHGLREALDHHLLERKGGAIAFRHVLVAEAVHARLLPGERRAIHRRWAEVLERTDDDPARLAHHWAEAGEPEPALRASIVAGDAALASLVAEDAARHYQRALRLWDQLHEDRVEPAGGHGAADRTTGRVDLAAKAAEATNWSGDPGGAVTIIASVLDDPGALDPALACALTERQAWYLLRQGRTDAARVTYQAAIEALPDDAPPGVRARVLAGSVRIWEQEGDGRQAVAVARRAVAAAAAGTDAERGYAHYALGRALASTGDLDAALIELDRAERAHEQSLDAVALASTVADRIELLLTRGEPDAALELSRAVDTRLRSAGLVQPHALLVAGSAGALLHRLGRADELAALAEQVVTEASSSVTLAVGHLLMGTAAVDRRAFGDGREHLEMARFLTAPVSDGRIAAHLAQARAELALAEQHVDAARASVDEGLAVTERSVDFEALGHVCLMGLRVASERQRNARANRSPRVDGILRRDRARYEAGLARALDRLRAEGRGDHGAFVLAAEAERARFDGADDPDRWAATADAWTASIWPRPAVLARLRQAEATLLQPGGRTDAGIIVEQALREAAAIGSSLLIEQISAVSRRAGIKVDAEVASRAEEVIDLTEPSAQLTRREREVLELVAEGRTNRQIGTTLYISTKTASVHVSRILMKLGASTRQEAAAMARRVGTLS